MICGQELKCLNQLNKKLIMKSLRKLGAIFVSVLLCTGILASCDMGKGDEDIPESITAALTTYAPFEVSSIDGRTIAPDSKDFVAYHFLSNGQLNVYKAQIAIKTRTVRDTATNTNVTVRDTLWRLVKVDTAATSWSLKNDNQLTITMGSVSHTYRLSFYTRTTLILRDELEGSDHTIALTRSNKLVVGENGEEEGGDSQDGNDPKESTVSDDPDKPGTGKTPTDDSQKPDSTKSDYDEELYKDSIYIDD